MSGLAINNHGRSALADADADEAFRADHQDCRFPVFGWYHINDGPLHCGACCPPPEFSPETLNKVAAIMAESIRRRHAEPNAERARADAEPAKAANRARQVAKLERNVKAIVDGWPKLTQEQRERLRPLLQGFTARRSAMTSDDCGRSRPRTRPTARPGHRPRRALQVRAPDRRRAGVGEGRGNERRIGDRRC